MVAEHATSQSKFQGVPGGGARDAVTWAEPQDLALDSEGSYSSLRLFCKMKDALGHNSATI